MNINIKQPIKHNNSEIRYFYIKLHTMTHRFYNRGSVRQHGHQSNAMASLWRNLLFKTMACALHTNTDEIERVSTVIPPRADFNEIIMVVDTRALAAQTTFDAWLTATGIKSFVCVQQPSAPCTAHVSITWERALLAAGWASFQQRSA